MNFHVFSAGIFWYYVHKTPTDQVTRTYFMSTYYEQAKVPISEIKVF